MPADLKILAWHASIHTTMRFYVTQSADDVASLLRSAIGNTSGDTRPEHRKTTEVETDATADTINA
jgi:hypothetical protein